MLRLFAQNDWGEDLIRTGSFWVTLIDLSNNILTNGVIQTKDRNVQGDSKFNAKLIDNRKLLISSSSLSSTFYSPDSTRKCSTKLGHLSTDIVFEGALAVSGGVDGNLSVWEPSNNRIKTIFEGHVGDIYKTRFFPSGKVVLSCGADTTLRIWNVSDGWCGAILKGHKSATLSFDLIDRGRNIISSSRDGTIRLWDCSTSSTITTFDCSNSAINDCKVGSFSNGNGSKSSDSREVGTEGKVVVGGSDNGVLSVHDIVSKTKIFDTKISSSINTVNIIEKTNNIVAGTEDGNLFIWDFRKLDEKTVLNNIRISKSSITSSSLSITEKGLWIGSSDGSCGQIENIFSSINNSNSLISFENELSGSNLDSITSVSIASNYVATASRDGFTRLYNI
eukprot:c21169_g2_i1.p1 GENE.c21169_g2_i1~~c21169_g2_i1.p1  ORF type:complete len:399 (+),score=137.60 c21169_g2_i1:22-1197(+)